MRVEGQEVLKLWLETDTKNSIILVKKLKKCFGRKGQEQELIGLLKILMQFLSSL